MPFSTSTKDGKPFKGTKKDSNKDRLGPQRAKDAAANGSQKHIRDPSTELTTNVAAKASFSTISKEAEDYAESPPAKRLKFHDNNAITVYVGEEKAAFTIHRGPICDTSAYFKALFESRFKETSEKFVTLSEHTPETFDQFLGFAYSRHLDRTPFEALAGDEERWIAYSTLYVLADYLDSPTLKATIIGILFVQVGNARSSKRSACITARVIKSIYENTLRNCGLRRLVVAQYIWGSENEPFRMPELVDDLDNVLAKLDDEFVAELAAESMRRVWDKKTRDPFKANAARFYDVEKPFGKQTRG